MGTGISRIVNRSPVPGPLSLLVSSFLDVLFPPLCHLCKAPLPDTGDLHLCSRCREKAPPIVSPLCPVCGVPFRTEDGIDHACGACSTTHPSFTCARSAMLFEGSVRELIHRFKYDRKVQLRRPLGLLAAELLRGFNEEITPDLIIPVPLHVRRLRERGFNQAVLIGEILSRQWHLPLSRNNLRRIRWTEPQIHLSADERVSNVRNAFAVADPEILQGKRILLVDDVYTTGSTVIECAKVLKRAHVAAVFVVTVARAVP